MSAAQSIHDGVNARRVGTCGCGEAVYADDHANRESLDEHGCCVQCVRDGEEAAAECCRGVRS